MQVEEVVATLDELSDTDEPTCSRSRTSRHTRDLQRLTIVDPASPCIQRRRQDGDAEGSHPRSRRLPECVADERRRRGGRPAWHSKRHRSQPRGRPLRRFRRRLGSQEQARRPGPYRSPHLRGRLAGVGSDATLQVERLPNHERLVHPAGCRSCSTAATRKLRPPVASCSFTSTSASPRSTRTATSPAPSSSTRTSWRARATGIAAHPRSSTPPCARSGSPATRR